MSGYSLPFHPPTLEENPLFVIIMNSKFGYMDRNGNIVIEPQFDLAYPFSEDLAVVAIGRGKARKEAYINKTGQLINESYFETAASFREGMACVQQQRKHGFINAEGEFVIPPLFGYADDFSEGLAIVYISDHQWEYNHQGKYIDKTGMVVLSPPTKMSFEGRDYDCAFSSFEEGLARFRITDYDTDEIRYGFINKSGETVIEPVVFHAEPFSQGLASVLVELDLQTTYVGWWTYMNKEGQIVIPLRFEFASSFSEGLAAVQLNSKFGFINLNGDIAIHPQFKQVYPFYGGFAAVQVDNKQTYSKPKWGFVNREGSIVIAPQFDEVNPFSGNLASVKTKDGWGYIDQNGFYVWKPTK